MTRKTNCGRSSTALLVAAVVVGAVAGVLWVGAPILRGIAQRNFMEAQARARIVRALSDMRNIGMAIESFHIDHGRTPTVHEYHESAPLLSDSTPSVGEPTGTPATLTHPEAYLEALPADRFRDGYPYDYWSDGDLWIVRSTGPDGTPDADLPALGAALAPLSFEDRRAKRGLPAQLVDMWYDPSNGLESRGDLLLHP